MRYPQHGPSADELTLSAVPLVHDVVGEVSARVPSCVDRDDLLSVGLVAAAEAARAYDPTIDGDFLVYANAVVRGEILVVLRSTDLRATRPEPVAVGTVAPDARLAGLRRAIDTLEARHRQVLDGYFLDERATAALAADLGLTEARVVQLRTEALLWLRDTLRANAIDPAGGTQRGGLRAAYAAASGLRRLVPAGSTPDDDPLPRGAA
ncbi:sigma-70 family RNA polymerase sigma factor [Nocardioides sp. YIM 152315]|uniref:sigma-70 family RNA polymerase sigma factor n=1 Tax=Nocardioides sp. YIM 152315 TaxID=3031760 RepID=UPI0023DBCFC6|nr:sigma-70 family RNA polymerase sigma factor [Nocardioides sp. YIM 152315]MDF1601930.1 sigma-70 family RNA polymerase sigma factor [Nocardioides sp. YIM 152315]